MPVSKNFFIFKSAHPNNVLIFQCSLNLKQCPLTGCNSIENIPVPKFKEKQTAVEFLKQLMAKYDNYISFAKIEMDQKSISPAKGKLETMENVYVQRTQKLIEIA